MLEQADDTVLDFDVSFRTQQRGEIGGEAERGACEGDRVRACDATKLEYASPERREDGTRTVTQEVPQGQRRADQEVVPVVIFEVLVRLDPLRHLSDQRTAWLLLVRVVPQYIDVLLLARDLDDRLDERGLAKVKRAFALQAISRQVLP